MNHKQSALQDHEIVNVQSAHQFHLNAINHLEKAVTFHREAIGNHAQDDFTAAATNTLLAQLHVGHASKYTAGATGHYCEPVLYK